LGKSQFRRLEKKLSTLPTVFKGYGRTGSEVQAEVGNR
jgi:hypothetical protein